MDLMQKLCISEPMRRRHIIKTAKFAHFWCKFLIFSRKNPNFLCCLYSFRRHCSSSHRIFYISVRISFKLFLRSHFWLHFKHKIYPRLSRQCQRSFPLRYEISNLFYFNHKSSLLIKYQIQFEIIIRHVNDTIG